MILNTPRGYMMTGQKWVNSGMPTVGLGKRIESRTMTVYFHLTPAVRFLGPAAFWCYETGIMTEFPGDKRNEWQDALWRTSAILQESPG